MKESWIEALFMKVNGWSSAFLAGFVTQDAFCDNIEQLMGPVRKPGLMGAEAIREASGEGSAEHELLHQSAYDVCGVPSWIGAARAADTGRTYPFTVLDAERAREIPDLAERLRKARPLHDEIDERHRRLMAKRR